MLTAFETLMLSTPSYQLQLLPIRPNNYRDSIDSYLSFSSETGDDWVGQDENGGEERLKKLWSFFFNSLGSEK